MTQVVNGTGQAMVVHLTGKLCKKLHVRELTATPVETGAHLRWYGHLFTAERVQYILTTNAASLYSVVMYGRGITDDGGYLMQFVSTLREHLEDEDLKLIYRRCIAPYTGEIVLAKTASRSVLGSMNDMVNQCKVMLARSDPSPWELTKGINDTPYGAIGYGFPRKVFARMPLES